MTETITTEDTRLRERWTTLAARAAAAGADALVISAAADLAYLTDYADMGLERLTAVVGAVGDARPTLLVPGLELARIPDRPDVFTAVGWSDDTTPTAVMTQLIGEAETIVVSDELWASHVIDLGHRLPAATLVTVTDALSGVRSVKTPDERDALAHAGSLADQVMVEIQAGRLPLVGRTEAEVADDIGTRLLDVGHDQVQFVIVGSGPNSASPHHHPGDRVIGRDELVLFDFGGTANGFNSDTTRCVYTGPIPVEVQRAWDTLRQAQQAAVDAARVGAPLCEVDAAARTILADAGYGEYFIHRTGHGIGLEVHEHPYVTERNTSPIEVGNAFSIEPGIYLPGRWGMRLEDIVVIEDDGRARRCNESDRALISVPG
ncbi:MAG: M24 family metallopeptidase [Actinomycetota bacterium]